jgi:lysophospholipase L1-like esterase
VASDSICSPIASIHSGEIHKRRGGRFGSIAADLQNLKVRFWDFDCVTLSIGINDAQDSVWKREQSWFKMQDFLSEQIQIRGYPAYKILINLPVPHWDAPAVPEYNHWIIEQINMSMPGVQVINWAAMNSDMFGDDGYPTDRMYSDDYFHLSHAGIYRFWKQWVSVFSRLQNVGYTVVNVKKEH